MEVAIVGGGIAGLILALTLHKHNVKCTIYEVRLQENLANPGAIGLAPNAIRPLDKLGLLEKLLPRGWQFTHFEFRDEHDKIVDKVICGDEDRYGYHTLRIVRKRLHDVLLAAVTKASIPIITGKKFSHIIPTTSPSTTVTFAFTDSSTATANILVGADGIHSTVHKSIHPAIEPEYKGSLTMAARLTDNPWRYLPATPDLNDRLTSMSINNGTHAAFLACIQSEDGKEIALGLDMPFPEQGREDWDRLLSDKQRQYDMFKEHLETWPPEIQVLINAVQVDDMYRSWPFYALPALDSWCELDERKLVLIGDAAHAVPPSAGQGACMAVEDAWSLGVVLAQCQWEGLWTDAGSDAWKEKVSAWQSERIARVDRVRVLTKQFGNARLPREQREKLPPGEWFVSGEQEDLAWLYGYDFQLE